MVISTVLSPLLHTDQAINVETMRSAQLGSLEIGNASITQVLLL